MKKFLMGLACFLSLFAVNTFAEEDVVTTTATNNDKVIINIFTKDGCPHCTEAEAFLEELKEDKTYGDMFTLVQYQVYDSNWNEDANNAAIMNSVAEKMGDTVEGVPYIVIADDYSVNGYASSMEDEIKKEIKENYEAENFVNAVDVESIENVEENDTAAIVIILVALVAGCTAFVLLSRKKETKTEKVEVEKQEKVEKTDNKKKKEAEEKTEKAKKTKSKKQPRK